MKFSGKTWLMITLKVTKKEEYIKKINKKKVNTNVVQK